MAFSLRNRHTKLNLSTLEQRDNVLPSISQTGAQTNLSKSELDIRSRDTKGKSKSSKSVRIQSAPQIRWKDRDYRQCNRVGIDMDMSEKWERERKLQKNWEENWGFLTQYDTYANKKPPEVIKTEAPSMFLQNARPVSSREYGRRLHTPEANAMQYFQCQMSHGLRRKKDLHPSE